jgi:hypothetical protein
MSQSCPRRSSNSPSKEDFYHSPYARPDLDPVQREIDGAVKLLALLGPSGCGKSTLLYLVGGFLPVEQGCVLVDELPVAGPGPDRGIVFQHFALFPWKTVLQNVLYGIEKQDLARDERLRRARHFIALVGLDGFEDGYPAQLSGGMKQRAAIARSDRALWFRLGFYSPEVSRSDGGAISVTRSRTSLLLASGASRMTRASSRAVQA